jgi:WD40 repeat protein
MEDRRAFNNLFLLSNGNFATYAEHGFAQAMVLILDLENDYKILKSFIYPFKVQCFINLPNNKFATGSSYVIRVYDISEDYKVKELEEHYDWVYSLAYIEKENLLISGSNDKTIKIWNMSEYKHIITMRDVVAARCIF